MLLLFLVGLVKKEILKLMSRIRSLLFGGLLILALLASACGGPTGEGRNDNSPKQTLDRVNSQLEAAAKKAQQRLQQADP